MTKFHYVVALNSTYQLSEFIVDSYRFSLFETQKHFLLQVFKPRTIQSKTKISQQTTKQINLQTKADASPRSHALKLWICQLKWKISCTRFAPLGHQPRRRNIWWIYHLLVFNKPERSGDIAQIGKCKKTRNPIFNLLMQLDHEISTSIKRFFSFGFASETPTDSLSISEA